MIQLAHRFDHCPTDAKIKKGLPPIILQHRGTDDQFATGELLGQECRDIGLAQTDHIREKDAVIGFQNFSSRNHRLLLVFQFEKTGRQVDVGFLVDIDVFFKIFVQEFEIKFVGVNLVIEPGTALDRIDISFG